MCLLFAGCNPPPDAKNVRVTGTITWNGNPIPEGNVDFFPVDGVGTPVGGKIVNGVYDLRVPVGLCRVEVHASREKPGQADVVMGMRAREAYIPIQYHAKSILSADVKEGTDNVFDFTLTDEAPKARP